jgi:hypothetical protein
MKQRFTQVFMFVLFMCAGLAFNKAQASHIYGSDLTYTWMQTGLYQVTLTLYRDCQGISANQNQIVQVSTNGCGNSNLSLNLDSMYFLSSMGPCGGGNTICNGGNAPDMEVIVYTGLLQTGPYSNCQTVNLSWEECCRSASIMNLNNSASWSKYVRTSIPLVGINNSPTFSVIQNAVHCSTGPVIIENGGTDPDGDQLLYTLVNPMSTGGAIIPFTTGFSASNPFNMPSFTFDPNTGSMQFVPNTSNYTYTYSVRIDEMRNGAIISSVTRDMTVIGSPAVCGNANMFPPSMAVTTNPAANPNGMIAACFGDTVVVTVVATDPDMQTSTLEVSIFGGTPNVQIIPNGGLATFYLVAGQVSTYLVQVSDMDPCQPLSAQQTFFIQPTGGSTVAIQGQNLICSPGQVPLSVNVPPGGTVSWSPAGIFTNPSSGSTIANITQTTTVTATVVSGSCTSTGTLEIVLGTSNGNQMAITTNGGTTICANETITLTAGTNGQTNIATYTVAPLTYPGVAPTLPFSLTLGDDALSPLVNIGFPFNFYGNSYTSLNVSSNGFLSFSGTVNGCCAGGNIPDAAGANNLIALFWEDLNPNTGGTVTYGTVGTAPNRRFMVSFNQVPFYGSTTDLATGYIVLHEGSNLIDVVVVSQNATTGTATAITQGVENQGGTAGVATPGRNAQHWNATNSAFRFTPQGTFTWSNGQTGSSITVAPTTTTTYVAYDNSGQCPDSATITITVQPGIDATISTAQASCNTSNGAIDLTVTAGAAPFVFAWSTGETTEDIMNLTPGTYCVTIIDANGCTRSLCDTVSGPFNIFTNQGASACGGSTGFAYALASGGVGPYTYDWSSGQTQPTVGNLPTGWYSVTVTDQGSGCSQHRNIFIGQLPNCQATISGYVYSDTAQTCNANGLSGLPNVLVGLSNGSYTYTDANGYYQFIVNDTMNYTVTVLPFAGVTAHCPSSGNISVDVTGFNQVFANNSFFVDVVASIDLQVTGSTYMGTRPGFPYAVHINACNYGVTPAGNVTVTYTYDPQLIFSASGTTAGYVHDIVNHTLTWTISNLNPFQCQMFNARFTLSQTALLGDTVYNHVEIQPYTNDVNILNNNHSWSNQITNSWDPNDKRSYPHHEGNEYDGGYIYYATEKTIQYAIRFQNLGTDTAYTVVIRDELDLTNLDLQSLRVIGASHDYHLDIEGADVLAVWFEDIMLPHAAVDAVGSNGWFLFEINLRENLSLGTQVENTAGIYFDFNEPVITNTTTTTLGEPTGVGVTQAVVGLQMVPNPANNEANLMLELDRPSQDVSVTLTDISGRVNQLLYSNLSMNAGVNSLPVNTSALPAGIYLIQVKTEFGLVTAKLSVVH